MGADKAEKSHSDSEKSKHLEGLEKEKENFMATGFTKDASAALEYYLEQSGQGRSAREIFDSLRKGDQVRFQGK